MFLKFLWSHTNVASPVLFKLPCFSKKQYRCCFNFNGFYKTQDAIFYAFVIDILPLWCWVCTAKYTLFMDIVHDFEIMTFPVLANTAACSSSLVDSWDLVFNMSKTWLYFWSHHLQITHGADVSICFWIWVSNQLPLNRRCWDWIADP